MHLIRDKEYIHDIHINQLKCFEITCNLTDRKNPVFYSACVGLNLVKDRAPPIDASNRRLFGVTPNKYIYIYIYIYIIYYYYYLFIFFIIFFCCQTINRIQNKSFCLHNIRVCTVYIYYVYINTNTCIYIFKKKIYILRKYYIIFKKSMLGLYIKYTVFYII